MARNYIEGVESNDPSAPEVYKTITATQLGTKNLLDVGNYNLSALVPESYDYIALTYVAAGNGAGEIETVVYKDGGSGGTTVATLTLAYDANNKLSTVTRT